MTCTQQQLDAARAQGIAEALGEVEKELRRASREVELARKPKSTFASSNRDRAILRLNVLKKVAGCLRAL